MPALPHTPTPSHSLAWRTPLHPLSTPHPLTLPGFSDILPSPLYPPPPTSPYPLTLLGFRDIPPSTLYPPHTHTHTYPTAPPNTPWLQGYPSTSPLYPPHTPWLGGYPSIPPLPPPPSHSLVSRTPLYHQPTPLHSLASRTPL